MGKKTGPPRRRAPGKAQDARMERRRREQGDRDDRSRRKLLERVADREPDGLITCHYGTHADTRLPDGTTAFALLTPKVHKLQGVCVGDRVWTDDGATEQERVIVARAERRSEVRRRRGEEDKVGHVIAANVDQLAITAALVEPPLRTGALDRYLVLASVLGLDPLIVVTKADQAGRGSPEWAALEAYGELAPVIATSSVSGDGLDALREHLRDRVTVFAGHSGVGKSSLCKALGLAGAPDIGEMSRSHGRVRGRHKTSIAQLLELPSGGWVVDTPGVRAIGLVDLEPDDARVHFPEFAEYRCQYPSCRHVDEDGCAVVEAVDAGDVPAVRYDGYRRLLDSLVE